MNLAIELRRARAAARRRPDPFAAMVDTLLDFAKHQRKVYDLYFSLPASQRTPEADKLIHEHFTVEPPIVSRHNEREKQKAKAQDATP